MKMIKRIDVREIPKELYSEGYKCLDFDVLYDKDGIVGPLYLKLVTLKDESIIIDNLKIHKEEQASIMKDFLKSITFEPGVGYTRRTTKYDFDFIKEYYGLYHKRAHIGPIIFRFVEEEQPCEEEEILDPITMGGRR